MCKIVVVTVSVLADILLRGSSLKLAYTTISGKSGAKHSSGGLPPKWSSAVLLPFLSLASRLCLSCLASLLDAVFESM